MLLIKKQNSGIKVSKRRLEAMIIKTAVHRCTTDVPWKFRKIYLKISEVEFSFSRIHESWFRSSHQRCSVRKGVFRNFTKSTGKHLCQSLFLIKLQAEACNCIKKETLAQVFSCEFCEIFKIIYFYRIPLVPTSAEN